MTFAIVCSTLKLKEEQEKKRIKSLSIRARIEKERSRGGTSWLFSLSVRNLRDFHQRMGRKENRGSEGPLSVFLSLFLEYACSLEQERGTCVGTTCSLCHFHRFKKWGSPSPLMEYKRRRILSSASILWDEKNQKVRFGGLANPCFLSIFASRYSSHRPS